MNPPRQVREAQLKRPALLRERGKRPESHNPLTLRKKQNRFLRHRGQENGSLTETDLCRKEQNRLVSKKSHNKRPPKIDQTNKHAPRIKHSSPCGPLKSVCRIRIR